MWCIRHGILAILLLPAGVSAEMFDHPGDLAKWISTEPPRDSEGRWFAANNDLIHQWVVFLRGDRPSVRLRAPKHLKGDPYPWMQEEYPPMPFAVPQGAAADGLGGEWFSTRVSDGWIIGFNAGEFGGGLWWFSPDGKTRNRISKDQVIGFIGTDVGLLALEGIAHGGTSRGRIIRLQRAGSGRWYAEHFVDLKHAPEVAVKGDRGSLLVATTDRLLRVHLATRRIDVLLDHAFWGGLYPNSMVVTPSGAIYVGMRHGVAKVTKKGSGYQTDWLLPNQSIVDREADELDQLERDAFQDGGFGGR